MAFSQSLQKGQIPVCCKLCETDIKISWKCIDCDLIMCDKCKIRIHPNIKNAKNHKVLDIKEVGAHTKELDFSSIKCKEHKGQVCVMFCKSCDQLVCPLCISKIHNGHGLVEIREGYQFRIQKLKEVQNNLKHDIVKLSKQESKTKEIHKTENGKYMEAKEKIMEHNIFLKKAVDQFTDVLLKELDQNWETLKNSIEKQENKVKTLKESRTDKEKYAKKIINANDVEQIFEESTELAKWLGDDDDPVDLNFSSMPTFRHGEIKQNNVGSLQESATDIAIKVIEEFNTDISKVFYLSPCLDSLWICSENKVQRVQPEASNLQVISRYDMKVYDMAVTPSNDLLLVSDLSTLKKISFRTGLLTDSCYNADPLLSISVHVTSDYQILVGARSPGKAFPARGRRVVILMDKQGQQKRIYDYHRNNQPIFTYPRNITTIKNRNICVIDRLSDDSTGRIVVLGFDGDNICIYNGHEDINTAAKPFKPVSIATTPSNSIVVSDISTEVLHILNSLGHLITHFNTRVIGIQDPFSLVVTSSGKDYKMYIGCTTRKGNSGMAKLYEVNISGF